jgi:hypothetical protein
MSEQDFPCPLLPVVCLDESNPLNTSHPLGFLEPKEAYLVMGEVALVPDEFSPSGGISHYILCDMSKGAMLPGMYHGDRFRRVTNDDDFF